jgi:hypothetical protein
MRAMGRSNLSRVANAGRMVVGLLACGLALAACSSVRPLPATASGGLESPPLATAAPAQPGGWVEPSAYTFTLESGCGERSLIGMFRVTVRNHQTVEFEGIDEAGRVFQGDAGAVPTLAAILKEAEDARKGNASSVEVETDPVDGHPVTVAIDWLAGAIDDEACYRVSDYAPD